MSRRILNDVSKIPEIKVTNSLNHHQKEVLRPLVAGKVSLYSCGPTVYGPIHIGNLRTAMTADLIFRTLTAVGYEVNFVRNYTDIDDKIIDRASEEKVESDVITKRYTQFVEQDYRVAGLLEPTKKPLVTEYVPGIIQMIERIVAKGNAYVTEDGEVLFSIDSYSDYGKLSGKKLEDLAAGSRLEANQKKKNQGDFSLWKPAKPGEPSWDSPWGKGRPGWHIECSAMAEACIGEEVDIHHGGSDLTFPHHENEIAQSECATGHKPYVRYWLHSGMLNMGSEKMSKSLGNLVSARDFLVEFGPELTRYFLLSVHYRSVSDMSDDSILTTLSSVQRLYEAKEKAESLRGLKAALPDPRAESMWGSFCSEVEKTREEMKLQICNDFNTPGVLGCLFTLIREWNRVCAEPRATATPSAVLGAGEFLKLIEEDLFQYMGLGRGSAKSIFEKIQEVKRKRSHADRSLGDTVGADTVGADTGAAVTSQWIDEQIALRSSAKKDKNFTEADRIRKELLQKGVQIKDSPTGTTWEWV